MNILVRRLATSIVATWICLGLGAAWAQAPTTNSQAAVQKAYVAYYGRPADPAGQAYWAGRLDAAGGALGAIISAFATSDEFNRRYGGLGYQALVTKIYQQTLGRNPDQAGLDYYVGELQAGRRTLQSVTLDVLNGATTVPDSTVVANKLNVAAYYTAKVATGCAYGTDQDGVNIISGVTATSATVTAAKATIDMKSCTGGPPQAFNMAQTLSDGAQRTTLAFSGLAMITGNLGAQSFFPPGKVADYTGFQHLRDNDPDNMGHNTSFLTRIANNVIFILDDTQFAQLKALAIAQQDDVDLYGYQRFPLMKAFRRLLDGDIPAGSTGLNLNAVKKASRELYRIDGQISFDRALLYASVVRSLTAAQKAYLDAMKGRGWSSWPDVTDAQIRPRMSGLPQGTSVAVMTYAGDIFSWYAGSLEADVYFCPERHGTYYGGFYIKDAPAVGHEGYSIDEQLTATAGRALSDAAEGYVTQSQASLMSSLVATQKDNLYASPTANIVGTRTAIAAELRTLLQSTTDASAVEARVLELSALYGELDGANNHAYATVFAQVNSSLTSEQRIKLMALRKAIMSGTYADGTPFDFSTSSTLYLYSSVISNPGVLTPYIGNTDYLFFEP